MDELAHRFKEAQLEYSSKIRTAAFNSAYVSKEHDVEDMEQELLIVLWESCRLYDPARGMSFNSFFWMRAKQKISMIKDYSNAVKRRAEVVSLDEFEFMRLDGDDIGLLEYLNQSRPDHFAISAEDEALLRLEVQRRVHVTGVEDDWRQQVERYAVA